MGILRVLLALVVVIAHSRPILGFNITDALTAVQMFYIISGFYMSLILTDKYRSYKTFITNRFLKLYPIYLVVLFASIVISVITFLVNKEGLVLDAWINQSSGISFLSIIFLIIVNLIIFGQDLVMFMGFNSGNLQFNSNYLNSDPMAYRFLVVPQAWTLGLELMFYVLVPFIVKFRTRIIVLLILGSIGLRYFLYAKGLNHDPWTYRFFPSELALFLLGILAHRIYQRIKTETRTSSDLVIFFLFLAFLTIFNFIDLDVDLKRWALYFTLTLLIPYIYRYFKDIKFDRSLGELSYPIYISHIIILYVMNWTPFSRLGSSQYYGLFAAIITLVVAYLLNVVVQKRVEVIRIRRAENQKLS